MRRCRIAVCMSGQPRTWRHCWRSIRKFFDPAGDVDYFISTWDHNTWFRHKRQVVEPASTEGLADVFDAKTCRILPLPKEMLWRGLFDSMEMSLHDKRRYEIENDFTYDIVVKSRLDLVFDPGSVFRPHYMEPMTAYTENLMERMPHEYYGANFSDIIFMGSSHVMDILGDCMRDASFEKHGERGPGTLLWKHMTARQIHPNNSDSLRHYAIFRENFTHLDPVSDYQQIVKEGRTWKHR